MAAPQWIPKAEQQIRDLACQNAFAQLRIAGQIEASRGLGKDGLISYARMVHGWEAEWFQEQWAEMLADPRKRRLALVAPPESGKSSWMIAFMGWLVGQNPQIHVGYISSTAKQAARQSGAAREVLRGNAAFHLLYPGVYLDSNRGTAEEEWFVTRGNPEDKDATVVISGQGGAILGARLDVAIIDDYSDFENTKTEYQREQAWRWLINNVLTRLNPATGRLIVIQTRWHRDDLIGRLQQRFPDLEMMRYPAFADEAFVEEQAEQWGVDVEPDSILTHRFTPPETTFAGPNAKGVPHVVEGPIEPREGGGHVDARAALEMRRKEMGLVDFAAQYQGVLLQREDAMYKRWWFQIVDEFPKTLRLVRFWDFAAGEKEQNDYTAGVLVGEQGGQYWVLDVIREHWSPAKIEIELRRVAQRDGRGVTQVVEQEPGASGTATAVRYVTEILKGYPAQRRSPWGDKVEKAVVARAAAENLNIFVLRAKWNAEFLEELELFPDGEHDDMCDSLHGSINELAGVIVASPKSKRGGRLVSVRTW